MKFIKSVTYHLHPTYAVNKFYLKQAPFLLSRVAWGYFEIEIDIHFQPWTRLNTLKLYHMLSFEGKGNTQSILLEIDDDKNNKDLELANNLAKQLKNLKIKHDEEEEDE